LERYFVPRRSNPASVENTFNSLEDVSSDLETRLAASRMLSTDQRKARLAIADPVARRVQVSTSAFIRNADVIVATLERVGGICEGCRTPAPFLRQTDGSPYLEVHHRMPLARGGPDTIDNAQALCPNCHRQRHFGKNAT
jgi:5-methylcytosine-specific restriction endonuclease McrA